MEEVCYHVAFVSDTRHSGSDVRHAVSQLVGQWLLVSRRDYDESYLNHPHNGEKHLQKLWNGVLTVMRNVHLTNCVDNVDYEKGTPAEQEDSHNDTHLGNNHILSIIGQLVTIIQIGFVIATMILTVMVALCSSIRLCESYRTFLTNQKHWKIFKTKIVMIVNYHWLLFTL